MGPFPYGGGPLFIKEEGTHASYDFSVYASCKGCIYG